MHKKLFIEFMEKRIKESFSKYKKDAYLNYQEDFFDKNNYYNFMKDSYFNNDDFKLKMSSINPPKNRKPQKPNSTIDLNATKNFHDNLVKNHELYRVELSKGLIKSVIGIIDYKTLVNKHDEYFHTSVHANITLPRNSNFILQDVYDLYYIPENQKYHLSSLFSFLKHHFYHPIRSFTRYNQKNDFFKIYKSINESNKFSAKSIYDSNNNSQKLIATLFRLIDISNSKNNIFETDYHKKLKKYVIQNLENPTYSLSVTTTTELLPHKNPTDKSAITDIAHDIYAVRTFLLNPGLGSMVIETALEMLHKNSNFFPKKMIDYKKNIDKLSSLKIANNLLYFCTEETFPHIKNTQQIKVIDFLMSIKPNLYNNYANGLSPTECNQLLEYCVDFHNNLSTLMKIANYDPTINSVDSFEPSLETKVDFDTNNDIVEKNSFQISNQFLTDNNFQDHQIKKIEFILDQYNTINSYSDIGTDSYDINHLMKTMQSLIESVSILSVEKRDLKDPNKPQSLTMNEILDSSLDKVTEKLNSFVARKDELDFRSVKIQSEIINTLTASSKNNKF